MNQQGFFVTLFVSALTAGCSFHMTAGTARTTPSVVALVTLSVVVLVLGASSSMGKFIITLGRPKIPASTPPSGTATGAGTATGTSAPSPATPGTPAAVAVLLGTNVFGQGTPDPSGRRGSFFVLPPATQKLPALASMQPTGFLFAKELNVANTPMTGGFPGIDATRNEDFALRWEAPLTVQTESTYTFRLASDDGSRLLIDATPIVDNDGQHTVKEASGPVHLVKGVHTITVEYFQATGPVALQLYCTKAGGKEMVCPTLLP